ncbi:radical SAM family heme chaperone HemW [Tissierella pigra]|uniref:Heme chaperone HemW n=1 Tax=Tissierella pigra TaxID=2607614 RepID=A0A6N7XLF0_9FIRM|nr:radical SAM family heme chaperone HemW [Tissierella pigra]MSU02911.1 oxygen-independent coproporphyrinogen III oxidase [Tissierella pigra]
MKEISLYIHIPFCISKCYYCDFTSFSHENHRIHDYISSLLIEMEMYKEKLKDYTIKTIFIGGGTPSSIDGKYIYKLLQFIYENFNTTGLTEITIEANPGTIDKEKVRLYKEAGINRVSMGVQTLDNNLLKSIGRIHTSEDFYRSYELLKGANIENINVDLIFGLPNQTIENVIDSLDKIIQIGVKHISYYGLILEENTKLYNLYRKGSITLPNEDIEREMYHKVTEYLINYGYNHYEISNYSLAGYECKHNLVYWDLEPYLGLGLSSHSYMENKRFFNVSNINNYIKKLKEKDLPIDGEEIINLETEIEEFCILGLRKIKGINKLEFKRRFDEEIENRYEDIINKHINNGLIVNEKGFVKLTKKGLDLSNLVEVDFLK